MGDVCMTEKYIILLHVVLLIQISVQAAQFSIQAAQFSRQADIWAAQTGILKKTIIQCFFMILSYLIKCRLTHCKPLFSVFNENEILKNTSKPSSIDFLNAN